MRENPVKRRLAAGEVVLGTMVTELMSPALFRLAALAGAEFVFLDQEHPAWSLETIRAVIAAGHGTDVVSIVRVPDAGYDHVAGTLDAGAQGVMIPNCEGEAEARAVVEWAKYPPLGKRGVGILRYDLEPEGVGPTLAKANAEQMVIAQIESTSGLAEVERIAAVDGIDVLWIGHYDLTTSLGIPGDFENPIFARAVARIVAACDGAGKPAGIMVATVEDGRAWLDRGFRCIAYGLDAWLYEEALRAGLSALRNR
jgi:2-dehydro-3-deoxyglucarate aldolase/4-hydroxy-2-oxoheptanedioate aldolase